MSDEIRCEGCGAVATSNDAEGLPLCDGCYDSLSEDRMADRRESMDAARHLLSCNYWTGHTCDCWKKRMFKSHKQPPAETDGNAGEEPTEGVTR